MPSFFAAPRMVEPSATETESKSTARPYDLHTETKTKGVVDEVNLLVPAGDHVAGGELFEDHAGHRTHVQGVDLDQLAGPRNRVLLGFARGVGTGAQGAARSRNPGAGRFHQAALLASVG
jgi:hypothetical protein